MSSIHFTEDHVKAIVAYYAQHGPTGPVPEGGFLPASYGPRRLASDIGIPESVVVPARQSAVDAGLLTPISNGKFTSYRATRPASPQAAPKASPSATSKAVPPTKAILDVWRWYHTYGMTDDYFGPGLPGAVGAARVADEIGHPTSDVAVAISWLASEGHLQVVRRGGLVSYRATRTPDWIRFERAYRLQAENDLPDVLVATDSVGSWLQTHLDSYGGTPLLDHLTDPAIRAEWAAVPAAVQAVCGSLSRVDPDTAARAGMVCGDLYYHHLLAVAGVSLARLAQEGIGYRRTVTLPRLAGATVADRLAGAVGWAMAHARDQFAAAWRVAETAWQSRTDYTDGLRDRAARQRQIQVGRQMAGFTPPTDPADPAPAVFATYDDDLIGQYEDSEDFA